MPSIDPVHSVCTSLRFAFVREICEIIGHGFYFCPQVWYTVVVMNKRMKITPIGVYGPYPPAGKAASCYLVRVGGKNVALDLGAGALSALQTVVPVPRVDAFVLTHLHYDHFSDATVLSYVPGKHTVYAPTTPSECFSLLKARRNLDVRALDDALRFSLGGAEFSFLRTAHGVEGYAVRIDFEGKGFVYTSDTAWTERLAEFCRATSVVLADCCGVGGSGHMTPADGARLARLTGARVIATHLPPDKDVSETLREAGLEQAEEGKEIEVW